MNDIIHNLKKDGMLLKSIPKKKHTMEICKVAIEQNVKAIRYASKKCLDYEICLHAVKKDGNMFKYVPNGLITNEMCELAVMENVKLLYNVPKEFQTKSICLMAIKNDVSTLEYVSQENRMQLFDNETAFDLIKKAIDYNKEYLEYMPARSDVIKLCIDYIKQDFSLVQYMPQQIKVNRDILNYQKSVGKLIFEDKYYNYEEKTFCVKVKINDPLYEIVVDFSEFDDFYYFLDEDLFDAKLRDYDFAGIDLKKYNITGAVIHSNVLDNQGLYDSSYFDKLKKQIKSSNITDNEIVIKDDFYYLKPVDDEGHNAIDSEHIPFFYISDIHLGHRICNEFQDKATKEEIQAYIKILVKQMVDSVGYMPYNSYLLIAGDTSSVFEFERIFYKELLLYWKWNKKNIIVISGNHELCDPYVSLEKNIKFYRAFFDKIGITYLQNDLCMIKTGKYWTKSEVIYEEELLKLSEEEIRKRGQKSSVIIYGGIGFSGLNKKFNASNLIYGKSFDELSEKEAWKKDIQETERFNLIYLKLLNAIPKNRVIILTHTQKPNWNVDSYNRNWIYVNGHNHRNFVEVNDERTIYANNQIGYKAQNIGLKYFYCDSDYDTFTYYENGIYKITEKQYIEFNFGKNVDMSYGRTEGTIYMIKKDGYYMFFMYGFYFKSSKDKRLYFMNGGKLCKLERNALEDLDYYFCNLKQYTENINQFLHKYIDNQQKLSEFVKSLGGSGKIHGCIVDIEKADEQEGYSYCHLFVNPIDGKITPYFAYDTQSRIVYKDFKSLLQAHSSCKVIESNYLKLEKESKINIPIMRYSQQIEEWENEKNRYDEGGYIYKISRIIKSLQYCIEKSIIRVWNERLLDYNFLNHITQAKQIDGMVDDKLLVNIEEIKH